MTAEQIAELLLAVNNWISPAQPLVRRLADEREALLGALREITRGRQCDTPGCRHRACCQAAIALVAIARAEEP